MTTEEKYRCSFSHHTSCLNLNATKALKDCSSEAKLDIFFHTSLQKCKKPVRTKFNSKVAYILKHVQEALQPHFYFTTFLKKKMNFFLLA